MNTPSQEPNEEPDHGTGEKHQEKPELAGDLSRTHLPPIPQELASHNNLWETEGIASRYAQFAIAPWYQSLNRELVQLIQAQPDDVVVDLGSGTGNLSRAIAAARGGSGKVIGIDSSRAMLQKANELTSASTGVEYREGLAENLLRLIPEPIHHITAANAIHLFDNLVAVLLASHRKLPVGGSLTFSSAFTRDAATPDSQPISKLIRALKGKIQDLDPEATHHSTTRNKIVRLDSEVVLQQMGVFGFRELNYLQVETQIPQQSLIDFFTLPGIGNALFPESMPTATRVQLLRDTLKDIGMTTLKRNWSFFRGVKQ